MEASAAGLAAGDGAAADGQADGEQDAPTLVDVTKALGDLSGLMGQQRDFLASEPWRTANGAETQPQTPAADEVLDFGFLDDQRPGFSQEDAARQLTDLIRGEAQRIAGEQLTPVQQEIAAERQERGLNELSGRYPQLQDEKVAGEVLDTAQRWVEAAGLPPESAFNPHVVETIFLAARAREQSQQGPDGSPAAVLEGAGGASPAGAGQGAKPTTSADWAQQVAPKRLGLFSG